MRDLEKIKPLKTYNFDFGKVSIIMMSGIVFGIGVFVVGLLLGKGKLGSAQDLPPDPLEELITRNQGSGNFTINSGGNDKDVFLEFGKKLENAGRIDSEPTLLSKEEDKIFHDSSIDEPFPADGDKTSSTNSRNGLIPIPEEPGKVVFNEPARLPLSVDGEKGIFTLHVNSFGSLQEASGYVSHLRKKGYNAFLVAVDSQPPMYRVRIGHFLSKNEAEKNRRKFEEKEGIPVYVVKRVTKD